MRLLLLFCALTVATPSFAHHPLNGQSMETFMHGMLSGVGHPILGFDHLFFISLIGIAVLYSKRRFSISFVYITTMVLGVLAMYFGFVMPYAEFGIVLSLIILGALVFSAHKVSTNVLVTLLAFFGFFHGSAFGQSIAGVEAGGGVSVLAGYLIGLVGVQYLIIFCAGQFLQYMDKYVLDRNLPARLSGAAVAGVGMFLLLEMAEGLVL